MAAGVTHRSTMEECTVRANDGDRRFGGMDESLDELSRAVARLQVTVTAFSRQPGTPASVTPAQIKAMVENLKSFTERLNNS